MKKIFTLVMVACGAIHLSAQTVNDIVFVDAQGTAIVDGTVIEANTAEDNGFELQVPSGLAIKNLSEANLGVAIHYTVESIDNGVFQICFPQSCYTQQAAGSYETEKGPLAAGTTQSLLSEWTPTADGSTKVTYQVEVFSVDGSFPNFSYNSIGMGQQVTVNFTYNSTAIHTPATLRTTAAERYDLSGRQLSQPQRGINIVRLSDGRVVKETIR